MVLVYFIGWSTLFHPLDFTILIFIFDIVKEKIRLKGKHGGPPPPELYCFLQKERSNRV